MEKGRGAGFRPRVGFIPKRLAIEGPTSLSLFPRNVLFGGTKLEDGKTLFAFALYEPDFASRRNENGVFSMRFDNVNGGSWLEINWTAATEWYHGTKYVEGKHAGSAGGRTWANFFVHFTALGLAAREACEIRIENDPNEIPYRPIDRSIDAFKDWIKRLAARDGRDLHEVTEEQWQEGWQRFWSEKDAEDRLA